MFEVLTDSGFHAFEDWQTANDFDLSEFEILGQGVSRTAYALNSSYVLKIDGGSSYSGNGFAGSNRTECEAYDAIPDDDKIHFARIVAHADDYSWLIAERADCAEDDDRADYEEIRGVINRLRIFDIHPGNYGYSDIHDRTVIIDFAHPGGCMLSMGMYYNYCNCNYCNCSNCNPNGCECESFKGCNEIVCSGCIASLADARNMMRDHSSILPTAAKARLGDRVLDPANIAETIRVDTANIKWRMCRSCAHDFDVERSDEPIGTDGPNQLVMALWSDLEGAPARLYHDMANVMGRGWRWHGADRTIVAHRVHGFKEIFEVGQIIGADRDRVIIRRKNGTIVHIWWSWVTRFVPVDF